MTKSSNHFPHHIPFLGTPLVVRTNRTPLGITRVFEKDGALCVLVPSAMADREVEPFAGKLLHQWFFSQARRVIFERVKKYQDPARREVGKITIKDTRSRWGSCSIRGNLNFNWRLVMAPLHIIDYVVIHELSHLVEMNHSSRFWHLVSQKCPDYRNHIQWLKTCGQTLFTLQDPKEAA